jgi:hypothetical protein
VSAAEVKVRIVGVENLTEATTRLREALAEFDTFTAQVAEAFTLWRQRYEADPDAFDLDWPTAETYGEACSVYFLDLLREVRSDEQPAAEAP